MLDQGANICSAVTVPVIGDGDTGYGNALNVKRTVRGYAGAGFAAVMIEEQRAAHADGSPDDACAEEQRRPDVGQLIQLHDLVDRFRLFEGMAAAVFLATQWEI